MSPNGQSWTAGTPLFLSIDITSPPDIERARIPNNNSVASGLPSNAQTNGLTRLNVGDTINLRVSFNFASAGQVLILGTTPGTQDHNTEFQFQFIKP